MLLMVHLVDLGLEYNSRDWPPALIDRMLPDLVGGLPGRADARELAAWLLGRGSVPQPPPWGCGPGLEKPLKHIRPGPARGEPRPAVTPGRERGLIAVRHRAGAL